MRIILCLVCFIFVTRSAIALNYYFSSISGNDARTASEAQDPSTPWKTLSKLNSIFSTLKPGDGVYLKRDETFYGSIIVKQSGSAASPITIGAFGGGSKPVITSLVNVTDWVYAGNGIWESYNASLGGTVNIVLLNGVQQEMGRYPNSNATNKGYLNFESHSGKTSITDNDLNTSINFKGAELVTRPRHWILNRSLITDHAGKKISYTTDSPYEPYENYGYFIQNSPKLLDKEGEWYYNPATKKISMYTGAGSPSNVQVSSSINDLISSSKFSNITFDNLAVEGANSTGFFIDNGSDIHIQNCEILFSGITGAIVHGHANLHVENCIFSNSNSNGIDMEYGVINAVIKNNKIINTALIPGLIQNGEGMGLAIYSNGDGATIEGNELRATGFIGMTFYGSNVIIKNNFIDSFCFVKDDGGGLYSHGGSIATTNRKVIDNIIINGVGAGPGTDIYDKVSVSGIYMDANTTNVELSGNTVTTCFQGIFIQSTTGMVVRNNTVFNNARQMTIIQRAGSNLVRNNAIRQNIFFSKRADQWTSYIMSTASDIGSFATFDSNYYARPIDDRVDIYTQRVSSGSTIKENFDLEGWKKKYGKDPASKITAKPIATFKVNNLIGSNKITEGDFNTGIKGVSASSCAISFSTGGLLDGGYLQITPSSTKSSVSMNIGAITAGKKYVVRYSVRGSADNSMYLTAFLKNGASPYSVLTPSDALQVRSVGTTRTENEVIFSATSTQATVAVVFQVDQNTKYYLDNIQVFEADAILTSIDDSLRFDYNATAINKTIPLNGNYIDTRGKPYANSITLVPFSSAILLKTGGGVSNIPPSISISGPANNAAFDAPASFSITAEAYDQDGSVASVEFYNGSTLLGKDYTGPYSFNWDNVVAGNYTLTAKAIDNGGQVTLSYPVAISVVNTTSAQPTVNITSPVNNASYIQPAAVTITAEAVDANGTIVKVEFYNGSSLLSTQSAAPYTFNWADVPAGTYSITAKATDNDGLEATSAIKVIKVIANSGGNPPPTVAVTAPLNNAKYPAPAASIPLIAIAGDEGGSIRKVEFFNGSSLLKTEVNPPYENSWKNVPAGNYTITAKATDNSGLVTISAPVYITVGSQSAARGSSSPAVTGGGLPAEDGLMSNLSKDNINATLAQEEGYKPASLSLLPNPAVNTIQVGLSGLQTYQKATLTLYDMQGVLVKEYPVILSGKNVNLDISFLPSGIYIISLSNDKFMLNKKFSKVN